MIRIALIVAAATCLTGCGQTASPQTSTRPPAATVTAHTGIHRLTIGSYCWSAHSGSTGVAGCADGGAPATYPGLARVSARIGETIVVRLRFTPTASVEATIGHDRYRLPAAATLRLRVRRAGILTLDPRRGSDDVQYVARIVTDAS
jgi:hypothetical protein